MKKLSNKAETYSSIKLLEPFDVGDFLFKMTIPEEFRFELFKKFFILRIEDFKKIVHLPSEPNRRTLNMLMFVSKGTVIRTKGLTAYELHANTFFFLPAYEIGSLEFIGDDAEGYYCHFSSEIFNQLIDKTLSMSDFSFLNFMGNPIVKVKNPSKVMQLLAILEDECINIFVENRGELITIYLFALLKELSFNEEPINVQHNSAAHITQEYKKSLSEHIYDLKSVADFADQLAITPNHLNKCVKAITGKSALELLNEMKILEAKVLLKQTSLTIAEIAEKIGKYEASDFSRFFKLKTNKTPLEYRQNK